MTLQEVIRDARQWLQEEQNTPGGGSPFFWRTLATQATDAVCRDTDCLMVVCRFPIVPGVLDALGTERYPIPLDVRLSRRGLQFLPGGREVGGIGFRIPGAAWERDALTGVAFPLGDDSVCPVPSWAETLVTLKAAQLRCLQFPTDANGNRLALIGAEYQKLRGDVAARAEREYRRATEEMLW